MLDSQPYVCVCVALVTCVVSLFMALLYGKLRSRSQFAHSAMNDRSRGTGVILIVSGEELAARLQAALPESRAAHSVG